MYSVNVASQQHYQQLMTLLTAWYGMTMLC